MYTYICLKCEKIVKNNINATKLTCPKLNCSGELVITDPGIFKVINKYHRKTGLAEYGKFVNVSENFSRNLKLSKNILALLPGGFELKKIAIQN